jgi:hypothetical protein
MRVPTVNPRGVQPEVLAGRGRRGDTAEDGARQVTIGVDPANPNRIVLGGSTLMRAVTWSASLFVCTV